MKATLTHYGVRGIFNKTILAELEAWRIIHNGVMARARKDIYHAIVPPELGVVLENIATHVIVGHLGHTLFPACLSRTIK